MTRSVASLFPRLAPLLGIAVAGWAALLVGLAGWIGVLGGALAIGATVGLVNAGLPDSALIGGLRLKRRWQTGIALILKDGLLVGILLLAWEGAQRLSPIQDLTPAQVGVGLALSLGIGLIYAAPMTDRVRAIHGSRPTRPDRADQGPSRD